MNKLRLLLIFFAGGIGALGILLGLILAPLRFDNPLYHVFGIQKPQIVGFQPYWLLEKATRDYTPYLTTFTFFALVVDVDGTVVKLVNRQEEEPGWTTLRSQKFSQRLSQIRRQGLKLSLLVHNANEASIAAILREPKLHGQNLVADVAPLMRQYGFADLNLDLESFVEASESAQQQFTTFVSTMKQALTKGKLGTLTVELTPISLVKRRLADPLAIGKVADYVEAISKPD